jgi:ABC-type multidrug transport system permease subunit
MVSEGRIFADSEVTFFSQICPLLPAFTWAAFFIVLLFASVCGVKIQIKSMLPSFSCVSTSYSQG